TPDRLFRVSTADWLTDFCADALACACWVNTPTWLTRLLATLPREVVFPLNLSAFRLSINANALLLSPTADELAVPMLNASPLAGEPLIVTDMPLKVIGLPVVKVPEPTTALVLSVT